MSITECGGKRAAVRGRQRIGLGIYFGVFWGFPASSVYLLLTDLHGCAYDVGASKYVLGGTTMATQELNIAPTDNGYMSMAVMMLSAIKDGNTDPVLLDGFVETVTYLKAIDRISSVADLG